MSRPVLLKHLFATALGLVAAIPAVVMYNLFSRWIAGYRALHADAAAEILRMISRDLDRGAFRSSCRSRRAIAAGRVAISVRLDHGEDSLSEIHEINVTPFIDVILVLLIIFMIAAPLATVNISVDLPAASAERTPRPDKPLFLTLKSDFSLSLEERRGETRGACAGARPGRLRATSNSGYSCAPTRLCPTES